MTGIIFRGLENKNFSVLKFYVARANRIIPALAVLCLFWLIIGILILTPNELRELGKHVVSSIGFFSNVVYWSESGYFDTASHEKWLLHTWSLSVEWQFYILYPFILYMLHKLLSIKHLKVLILSATVLSFGLSVYVSYKWPSGAYYLLSSRVWEMLLGGVAFLYPIKALETNKRTTEIVALLLILGSYLLVSESTAWPGYLALLPVMGAFLIIQSRNEQSFVTGNVVFQKIGAWSYSIYLWHWPLVVLVNYYSLPEPWVWGGVTLSLLLGHLSHRYIENNSFSKDYSYINVLFTCRPVLMVYLVGGLSFYVYQSEGSLARSSKVLSPITNNMVPSPYRDDCHTGGDNYTEPNNACTYFEENVTWAIIGDSHTVELAYVLARGLESRALGIKHLSFSGCVPSYNQNASFSPCAKWTNDAVKQLLNDENIENVVINYRYTAGMFGDQLASYPALPNGDDIGDLRRSKIVSSLDQLITVLSENKKNVFVVKPIPELGAHINVLLRSAYKNDGMVENITGTSKAYYLERNAFILNYFQTLEHADNVRIIDPASHYCDDNYCWAVMDGIPIYFDDDHLSLVGAVPLSKEILSF